jgi:hypothetical protein
VKAKATAEAVEANALLEHVLDLRDRALDILGEAEEAGDLHAVPPCHRPFLGKTAFLAPQARQGTQGTPHPVVAIRSRGSRAPTPANRF